MTIFDRIAAGDADVMITDAIEARLQQHLHPKLCAIHPDSPFDFSEKVVLLPREAQIIASLGHQASDLGVPQPWAEGFFKAQIEASKIAQNELFHGWDVVRRGQFADAPDLATVTRPKLDRSTELLLHALSENWPILSDPKRRDDVLRALHPMQADELSPKAVAEAIGPVGR